MTADRYLSSDPDALGEILALNQYLTGLGMPSLLPGDFFDGLNPEDILWTVWDPVGFLGQEHWGWIGTGPVVHPAALSWIARLLGLSPEQVRQIAWWQAVWADGRLQPLSFVPDRISGAEHLLELLQEVEPDEELLRMGLQPTDLILQGIGVPPIADRPLVAVPGGRKRPQLPDVLYNHLALQAAASKGMDRSGKDLLWERSATLPQQILVEQICHAWSHCKGADRWEFERSWRQKWPLPLKDGWSPEDLEPEVPEMITPDMVPEEWEEENELRTWQEQRHIPLKLLPWSPSELLVQFSDRVVLWRLDVEEIEWEWPTYGELLGRTGEGFLAYRLFEQVCLMDPRDGEWKRETPAVDFVYMDEMEQEKAYLVNLQNYDYLPLLEVLDQPINAVPDNSGAYLWVEDSQQMGGIYELSSGELIVSPGRFFLDEDVPLLMRDGSLVVLSEAAIEIMEETLAEEVDRYMDRIPPYDSGQDAFCLRDNRWWFFSFNIFWKEGQALWRSDMPTTANCFSPDGRTFFQSNDRELRVVELNAEGMPTGLRFIPMERISAP